MKSLTNTLISASAGTGKTYQLSLRFLSLMALGVPAAKMIAITFTKKAAGEFIDRILTDLAKGASSPELADILTQNIYTCIKGTEIIPGLCPAEAEMIRENLNQSVYIRLLKETVTHLEKLNLSTIDSLFNNIIGILATEQGLSQHQIISTAQSKQEHYHALLSLFRECALDPQLSEELSEAFSLCYAEAKEMQMDEALNDLINNYHELFLDLPIQEQWGNLPDFHMEAGDLHPELTPTQIEEKIKALQSTITENTPTPNAPRNKKLGKVGMKTFQSFFNGVRDYLRTGKFTFTQSNLDACRKQVDVWSPDFDSILSSIYAMETKSMFVRTRKARTLIEAYERHYGELVRQQGKFLFHDTTRMLEHAKADIENNVSAIAYRMDTQYDHWMLDEFQDTSISQWNILSPFIHNTLADQSGQKSLFIVGDGKQSIYQWRGGEPKLFESLQHDESWKSKIKLAPMNVSYRSAQAVLDMANAVCQYQDTAATAHQGALQRWQYQTHKAAKSQLNGYSCILQSIADSRGEQKQDILLGLVNLLQQIKPNQRQIKGNASPLSCAILVNTKKEAVRIKNFINEHALDQEIEICEDIAVGVDSPLGQSLRDFFVWLLHPSDRFAKNHLTHSPLRTIFHEEKNLSQIWTEWKSYLDTSGYGSVMRRLKQALPPESLNTFHESRLDFWVTEADRYDNSPESLQDWINHITLQSRRATPPEGVIQIMTIHKSKGLEFDIVLLPVFPEADSFTDKTHFKSIIAKNSLGEKQAVLLSESTTFLTNHPKFAPFVTAWEEEQQYEGFCKLYVALTRAARATYILIPPPPKKPSDSISFKSVLNSSVEHFSSTDESSIDSDSSILKLALSYGQSNWWQTDTEPYHRDVAPPEIPYMLPKPPQKWERRTPSADKNTSIIPNEEGTDFGNIIHQELSKITWITPETLPKWEHLEPRYQEYLTQLFSHSNIQDMFTQKTPDEKVMCEQHIQAKLQNTLYSCCIDRLVLHHNHAHIYDYKTDHIADEQTLIERYSSQLELYREALAAVTHLPTDSIQISIVSTYLRKVINV